MYVFCVKHAKLNIEPPGRYSPLNTVRQVLGLTASHSIIKCKSNPRSDEHCFSLSGNARACNCMLWIKFKR